MSEAKLREALRDAVADLRERWIKGAPKDDSYKIGFNAGLWNALLMIEGAVEEAGIDPAEIGLEQGWAESD